MFVHHGQNVTVNDISRNAFITRGGKAVEESAIPQKFRRAAGTQPDRQAKSAFQMVAQVSDQHIFRDLFAGEFLRIYLPTASNCPQVPLTWLQLVYNVPAEGPLLDHAMAVISLSVVGLATKNPTLVVEGSREYGKALREMQHCLWHESLMYRDETLAACNALVFYEVLLLRFT